MIDWDKPLETVNGTPVLLRSNGISSAKGIYEVYIGRDPNSRTYRANGKHYAFEHADIRNKKEPTMKTGIEMVERMEALVRRMAECEGAYKGQSEIAADWEGEAVAIVAELAPRVDPDLIEARDIAKSLYDQFDDMSDDSRPVRLALAAIKRGREMERGE